MRFPDNPIMKRVFELFGWLEMPHVKPLQKDTANGSLIPYSMTNLREGQQNEPFWYNDTTKWGSYIRIAAEA